MVSFAGDNSHSFDRLLLLSEVLQGTEGAATAGVLAMTLSEQTGRPWSQKTVSRDLALLMARGFVLADGAGKQGGAGVRWRWNRKAQLFARRA